MLQKINASEIKASHLPSIMVTPVIKVDDSLGLLLASFPTV